MSGPWSGAELEEMAKEALQTFRLEEPQQSKYPKGCPQCGHGEFYVEDRVVIGSCEVADDKLECEESKSWDTYLICHHCGAEYYMGGGM